MGRSQDQGGILKKTLLAVTGSNFAGVLSIVIIMVIVMGLSKPEFLTANNFNVLARSFSIFAIVGLSQMVILAMGGMNLSVGAIGGLVGITVGSLMVTLRFPVPLAIFTGLVLGATCGFINGWMINRIDSTTSKLNVSSFLVTLATASVFAGINLGITRAMPIYNLPSAYIEIGRGTIGGFTLLVFIMLIIAAIVAFIFNNTGLGRMILAVGGNTRAAELSGVLVGKVTILTNVISGLLAASAAILVVARLGSAQPDVGSDWLLLSFAAPLIGGTRLAGGQVNILGTIFGAILLSLVSNSLVHLQIDVYWATLIHGLFILMAVGLDRIRTVSSEKWRLKTIE